MKNIHVLPTDKPSRLGYLTKKGKEVFKDLRLFDKPMPNILDSENQHIYITSDEEIKDEDWAYCPVLKKPVFICLESILMLKYLGIDSNGNPEYKKEWLKKIILTTDPKLIDSGVQAIDDEFLKWFVKNPSCEFVEVDESKYFDGSHGEYIIIIPQEAILAKWDRLNKELEDALESAFGPEESKYSEDEFEMQSRIINKVWDEEEPKQEFPLFDKERADTITNEGQKVVRELQNTIQQETLEEAEKEFEKLINGKALPTKQLTEVAEHYFIVGYEIGQEKRYSEEEVIKLLIDCKDRFGGSDLNDYTTDGEVKRWFEQFKNKI